MNKGQFVEKITSRPINVDNNYQEAVYSRTACIFVYWLPILSYFKRLESHTGRVHLSSCSIKQYMYLHSPLVDGTPFTGRIRQIDQTTFIVCVCLFFCGGCFEFLICMHSLLVQGLELKF